MNKKILVVAVLALFLVSLSAALVSACPPPPPPGTGTPGYWKNHPEAWPVDKIVLSHDPYVFYTQEQAIDFMNTPDKGDKTYTLFRALAAARLNQLAGNDTSCPVPGGWTIQDLIWQANGWLIAHPPGSGVRGSSDAWQDFGEWKYEWLDAYNNGELCAPSRDALE
jgi:hypothetical protein